MYVAQTAGLPVRVAVSVCRKTSRKLSSKSGHNKQNRIPASYYRGGTSRALMFVDRDLPADRQQWAPIFTGTIGSPDANGRQLDGMGGGISSLSKVCVVSAGSSLGADKADVDYTFAQVQVKGTYVDYAGNCGNMSAAIGPFAYDNELVDRSRVSNGDGTATVRIHNTNTGKLLNATFPIIEGEEAATDGDFAIDGVGGTGAKIELNFIRPGGSKTGKLLPTGNVIDVLEDLPEGVGSVHATLLDAANPAVFVDAAEIGVEDPTVLPAKLDTQTDILRKLEIIRTHGSVKMGITDNLEEAAKVTSIPKICFVSRPSTHKLLDGRAISAESVDVVVRAISVGQPHRAIPITLALATAAAAKLPGTIVNRVVNTSKGGDDSSVTIGHASGTVVVDAEYMDSELMHVTVFRTARRLFEGMVFWRA
ncbi:PrpF protein [Limtongia smithiae]|uniref:PrpF protein n=1 Tax=Limtongia smithiae TaxID=1125753 RepID=UPI0034CFF045